ncbi:MAG: M20/M25/M40 family metallo-hydrolase [Bilophila sp.]
MELSVWKQSLDAWFDAHEQDMLTMVERVVNMDSFSHDAADVNRLGEVITGWMAEAGFRTEMLQKRPAPADEPWMASLGNVFTARTHPVEAGPGVALIGHMDTVFPAGTAASRPFRLDRSADRATGPGIVDMKSGLVVNMFVARALKELGLMDVPMTLTFSPDEELGSPSTTPLLGEQLNGAHAVICTEPGYAGGGVSVERKGSGHLLLEIEGVSAHAGRCYADGASAILELAHKILAFNEHLDLANGTTVNTGLVSGGTSANSVAPNATARVHLTFRTLEAGRRLVEAIRADAARTWVPRTVSRLSGGLRLYPLTKTPQVMALFDWRARRARPRAAQSGKCARTEPPNQATAVASFSCLPFAAWGRKAAGCTPWMSIWSRPRSCPGPRWWH